MGIREEIRRVISQEMGIVVEGGEDMVSRSLYKQRDRVVDAVLSILDEWELVAEEEMGRGPGHQFLSLGGRLLGTLLEERGVEPRDHIIIYRRKKR